MNESTLLSARVARDHGLLRPARRAAGTVAALSLLSLGAAANHGPGTSGSGSSTISGETLLRGQWELSLRNDATWFEHVDAAEAEARALASDGFDAIQSTVVQNVGLSYGVTDDLQLGATIGWYWGSGFIDAEPDGLGGAESSTADPEGLTDLWLNAKWRVARGPSGHVAVIGGVKLPTGVDDETLDNGELLESSSQPGTGAVDGQLGVAWSRYLTARVTLDASGLYTLRGEHDDFRVGDRADLGLACAWRLTPDVRSMPNWSLAGELQGIWIGKDEDAGETNPNSGGWTVYASAGLRVRFDERFALTVAPAVPVLQDLNGDQVESRARLSITLSSLI